MPSFNGTPFDRVLYRGNPSRRDASLVAVQHIPGGDNVYIDLLGRLPGSLSLPVRVSDAQLAALRGQQLNKRGTLDAGHIYQGPAVLEGISSSVRFLPGWWHITLEFTLA